MAGCGRTTYHRIMVNERRANVRLKAVLRNRRGVSTHALDQLQQNLAPDRCVMQSASQRSVLHPLNHKLRVVAFQPSA